MNGDGSIDREELTKALTSCGQNFTQQEINVIFNEGDVNKDGSVDYEEFIGLMCPSASDIVSKFRSQYKNIEDVRARLQEVRPERGRRAVQGRAGGRHEEL